MSAVNASSKRTHWLTRAALALGLGVMAVLAGPVAAQGSVPAHGTFSDTETFVDTEVCAPEGFAVDVTQTETGAYRLFFDTDGNFTMAIVHMTYVAKISANGHTIYESDRWQDYFAADGTSRQVGLTVHIKGPGGIVQQDAGQIGFNEDGSVAYIHGPHPQAEGQTFCFALLP
jgi:hypothetical protein